MIFNIIKKLVWTLCILYTINILISKIGKIIPINIWTITIIYFFDLFGVLAIVYFKYYY